MSALKKKQKHFKGYNDNEMKYNNFNYAWYMDLPSLAITMYFDSWDKIVHGANMFSVSL